ncbi:unnamed protein product [Paramecium primaurelia]|uniref:Uncharacterized protein n=1 Tax=Paramecium primaurelia TaxID=5886 RepID=A0A8S1LAE5_PARPR|nr:unnamed protein product [Paramecium primaurelia]
MLDQVINITLVNLNYQIILQILMNINKISPKSVRKHQKNGISFLIHQQSTYMQYSIFNLFMILYPIPNCY